MDPISFTIELELGQLVVGLAGLLFTWVQHQDQKARYEQRDRHHQERLAAFQASAEKYPDIVKASGD